VIALNDEYPRTPENLNDDVRYEDTGVLADELLTDDVNVLLHLAALSSYAMYEENPKKGVG